MQGKFRIKMLVAAMTLAAWCTSMDAAAQSAANNANTASSTMVVLHPAVTLRSGDKVVEPLTFSQPMHVVVALKLRNEQQLDEYIAKPGFKPLTSGQFQMMYGPTKQQAQSVADYLTKTGFNNVKIVPGNALVEAYGRADTAQAAFKTSFVHVKTRDGRDAFANSSAIQIPANLQGVVHAVLGMQNVHVPHSMAHAYNPTTTHDMVPESIPNGAASAHPPSDFPVIYGAGSMANVGSSVPVGSISAGPMSKVLTDLNSVAPGVTITLRGNTAVGNGSGTNSGDGEWDLDSQSIIAFTGVKQYYFYVAASMNEADLSTAIAQVVSDNTLKAIDYSLGICETIAQADGTAAANDTSFKQAVAQGQTFFVSAGDLGADECNDGNSTITPAWPASSRYVTAVGATELFTSPATTYQFEYVWNDNSATGGATGGSPSTFEPIPSWQQGVPGIFNQTYRGVPDIAFSGASTSGALITVDGQPYQSWGTSLSAPLAVGMWAHVLQADGTGLGFASPVIYKVAQMSKVAYGTAFNDVSNGNNNSYGSTKGFYGLYGWDYASGWGSVNVSGFASLANVNSSSASSPLVSFGTLPALQVTTPVPGSTHTPGDFNGDGISDLLWFNPLLSKVGLWTMTATANASSASGGMTRTGLSTYNVTPGYFVGAVGDFNGDGYADLVFTSANRDLWLWTNNHQGGWTSTRINNSNYPSQWQLIGAGDVDGDGYDDLLWLDPSDCKFGYWTMRGATVTGYHTVNIACGYYPVSVGYYTPSNRLSIIWTSPAGDLYIWDSTGTSSGGNAGNGFNAYALNSFLPANPQFMSIGGGYQGQNIGLRMYVPSANGSEAQGMLLSRSFDANGKQTGVQATPVFGPNLDDWRIGSAGYVIAGNGVNNTGVYNIDPDYFYISTGGLQNNSNTNYTGNAPEYPALTNYYQAGNHWDYPNGWWVVGALFNNSAAPPWQ